MSNFINKVIAIALGILGWLWIFITPILPLLGGLVFIMGADTYFGIRASINRNIPIRFNKLLRLPAKIIAYFIMLLVAHVFETIIIEGFPMLRIVVAAIGYHELKSVIKHFSIITNMDLINNIYKFMASEIKFFKDKNEENANKNKKL